ncbi:MAG: aquaporin [Planctomycetota bacterium]|jgi:aquaporin Z
MQYHARQLALAEILGTFALIFIGTGVMVVNDLTGGVVGHAGVAMTWGLIVMVLIYAIGDVSGAHMNPAVTIAFAAARRFPWRQVPLYVGSQCVGALLGSVAVWVVFGDHQTLGASEPLAAGVRGWVQAGMLEVIASWLLMFVILGVSTGAKEKGLMAGVAVGGTVLLLAMCAGPICGASMNPARSLAPAVVAGRLHYLPLYLVAPVLGTLLATVSLCLLRPDRCCPSD